MLFSIIIPTYNEEESLPSCLSSIFEQSFDPKQYEVIVVDNGSRDRTREIAQQFGAMVLVNDKKNVSGLRNLGVQNAKGNVLAFIDADCMAESDWLERAYEYCNQEYVIAWGAPPGVPDNATWVQKSWFNLRKKNETVQVVDWLESMNLFVRKETFIQFGGFNESLITCEDVDFSYRIGEVGQIIADKNIRVLHLGEAKNIREFITKEFWRGLSNYHGFFSHKIKWSELPSLAVPLYFAIFLPALALLSILTHDGLILSFFLMAIFLPAVAIWFKVFKKKLTWIELIQLQILVNIYFAVRTVSAFKGIFLGEKN